MQSAAQHMVLTLYRNQLMHVFVRIAMVTISINACPNDTLDIGQNNSLLLLELHLHFLKKYEFLNFYFRDKENKIICY